MKNIDFLIGKIAGIILVLYGFINFLLLDKICPNNPKVKKISGMIILSLTIITLSCGVTILIKFLIQQITI